jgi:hypothetical protein
MGSRCLASNFCEGSTAISKAVASISFRTIIKVIWVLTANRAVLFIHVRKAPYLEAKER